MRRVVPALGFVVACAHQGAPPSAAAAPANPPLDVAAFDEAARDGWERFLRHDYPGAARSYERALSANPGDDVVLYLLALASLRAGDSTAAMDRLARLAELGSDLVPREDHFHDLAARPAFRAVVLRTSASAARHRRSSEAFRVPEKGLLAEGIAFDPVEPAFYIGSVRRRKIVKLVAGQAPVDFVSSHLEVDAVGGLRIDVRRRRLWAVSSADSRMDGFAENDRGRNALLEFELATRKLVGLYRLTSSGEHSLNDVALDAKGRPFVTDTASGQIYTLAADGRSLEPLFDIPPFLYPNGITFDDEGRWMFVGDATGVVRVDVATRKTLRLLQPQGMTLLFFDGLYFVRSDAGPRLVGVQIVAGPGRVVSAALNPALDAVVRTEILESNHPAFDAPTTGAVVGSRFFFIANSQQWVPHEPAETIILTTPL
jgi:hypothetical protein